MIFSLWTFISKIITDWCICFKMYNKHHFLSLSHYTTFVNHRTEMSSKKIQNIDSETEFWDMLEKAKEKVK